MIWTSQPRTQPTRADSKWWRMDFPLFHRTQLANDTTMASLSHHALCAEAAVSCARAPRPSGQDPTRQGSAECLASLAALCISSGQLHASFSGSRQDKWIRTSPRESIWQCACDILQIEAAQTDTVKSIAPLPLVLGGLDLRNVERVPSACLTVWAHCIRTINARHPVVAASLVNELGGHPHTPCLRVVQEVARSRKGVLEWSRPSWFTVRNGVRLDIF